MLLFITTAILNLNGFSFELKANAAGRLGIHPLVKVTACYRQLAYGTSADQLDEQLQIADSTFLETRQSFCDVQRKNNSLSGAQATTVKVSVTVPVLSRHSR